jgi:predicted ATPase with chaperone activity
MSQGKHRQPKPSTHWSGLLVIVPGSDERRGETSAAIRARVEAARDRQTARFAGTKLACNADMGPTQVRDFCHVDETSRQLLGTACAALAPALRSGASAAEAIQYRPRRQE